MQPHLKQVLEGKKKSAVITGDCGYILLTMPDACVDAAIIDPPGALNFCNKDWDGKMGGRDAWVKRHAELLRAHTRVVKPGRFIFVWSFPRTSHWTGLAIEDSGVEIVDCFYHLFSHRRPASPDLLKPACEMWWLCRTPVSGHLPVIGSRWQDTNGERLEVTGVEIFEVKERGVRMEWVAFEWISGLLKGRAGGLSYDEWFMKDLRRTPKTGSKAPESGSAVKLGICSCLIPAAQRPGTGAKASEGRHPTNLCITHAEAAGEVCSAGCLVDTLDKMSGQLRSGVGAKVSKSVPGYKGNAYGTHTRPHGTPCVCYGDQGGASRFFSVLHNDVPFVYVNRASKKERNAGLPEGMTNEGVAVKPLELMVRLVKLANVPPGGIVLDGFAGTGSTGCACAKLGIRFIGIEKNPVDAEVARRRIAHQGREA